MKISFLVGNAIRMAVVAGSALFALVAFAQTSSSTPPPSTLSPNSIAFPVAALGNCTDQASCHAYCNEPVNMKACTAFAESNGIESAAQAKNADQFAALFANAGTGPGGCSSPDACDAYCTTVSHLSACVAFAKAHDITGGDLGDAEKVLAYLNAGGTMPGGCDSKDSCNAYCSDESHAPACAAFSEKAGLRIGGQNGGPNDVSPEALQKFQQLLQSGGTPGGCTTLQACLTYCNDPGHGSACGAFGEAMGAAQGNMKVTQAGPGGCTSDASCQAYCSDPAHAAECQAFSKQSNYNPGTSTMSHYIITGSSTPYGHPGGCGENEYWNGSECVASPAMVPGGTPPPCPAGQICNFNEGGGAPPASSVTPIATSTLGATILYPFASFMQMLGRLIAGRP